jgi:hypothetical protein
MRMIMYVSIPVDPFNAAVRDGSANSKMKKIMDTIRPEAAYFTDRFGERSGVLIVDLADPSGIPALAEPWFLYFNAKVELHPVMVPEDLMKAGLEQLGKTWA